MSYTSRITHTICIAGSIIGVIAAQEAPKPQLTARELFYSAANEPAAKAPPSTATKGTAKKPVADTKKQPAQAAAPAPKPDVPKVPYVNPPHVVNGTTPMGGTVRPVVLAQTTAPAPATGTALGLKYTILKRTGSGTVEVPRDTVFHAGDAIQIAVQTNGPGYLYVISQGSSGTWQALFPSTEIADGNNRVDAWHSYVLPAEKYQMTFDQQSGVDKLFVVFSREPESDLEKMIYSLQGNKAHPAVQRPQEAPKAQRVQIAGATIDDSTVGHLRETYTRDLIVERVDDKTPADKSDKKENAFYVVNPTGSSDSRVVADLTLVHQ
jgi:Domain of unknown function (DUF4384)